MDAKIREKRIQRLFQAIEEEGTKNVDMLLFANAVEPHVDLGFFYVSGVTEGVFENSTAIVLPDGSGTMVTSILEETTARKSGMELLLNDGKEDWEKNLKKVVGKARRIGVHSRELTHSTFKKLQKALPKTELVDVSEAVITTRLVKDRIEIEATRKACKMASMAAEQIVESISAGVKEYELAAELTYTMQKQGASGNSFSPISSFGPNSAEPHYLAGDAVARKKETVLLDFGCYYKRYSSDITRTYYLGKASKEQREMYELVHEAQAEAIDSMAAGVDGAEVDKRVRE
ncbi:MAG: aminopeptidase P family protein, partial [Thermoplasmata archaeon]|nr:aminopeptidase P family protein [Thermoplasmata archaeon]